MSILMHFNRNEELTIDQLALMIGMKREQIIPHLQSVVKVELLKIKSGESDVNLNTKGETTLCLNKIFTR